jgi:tRNA(Ile)-lysidine synthase
METLTKTAGKSKDLEQVHINQLLELFSKQTGARLSLPYAIEAKRDYTGVTIYIRNEQDKDYTYYRAITATERLELENGNELKIYLQNNEFLILKILDNYKKIQNLENFSSKKYTKLFDYGKIKGGIAIRTRKTGDYLAVNSSNQTKKLKSYFTDEKIPKDERDRMLLLADDSHIMWVIGARISNYYKIADDTQKILQATYYKEDKQYYVRANKGNVNRGGSRCAY